MINCRRNVVGAARAEGYTQSIAQLWGSGPKWTIRCGDCGCDFKARVPMVNSPRVLCTCCGAINELAGLIVS